jgi:hypothetical protein
VMRTNTSPIATVSNARHRWRPGGAGGRPDHVTGAGGNGRYGWEVGGGGSSSRFIDPSDRDPDVVLSFHRPATGIA